MVTRADVVAEARTWLGVRWRDKGRTRNGIDCAGLPIMVGKALGLTTYDKADYPRRPDGTFVKVFRENLTIRPINEAEDGDVLLFQERGCMCHCGIRAEVDGEPGVIHAYAMRREVTEDTLEEAEETIGKPRFAFTFPGLED